MKVTVAEAYALPDGQHIELNLPQGGWAHSLGIIALCHGDEGIVVGRCKVPYARKGQQQIIDKIIVQFPVMGGLRLIFSAEEISQCFKTITVN